MTLPIDDAATNRPAEPDAAMDESLQFDNAEYAGDPTGRVGCSVCQREIDTTYYEINGKMVCDGCKDLIQNQLSGGRGWVRFARAILFGAGAAVAGALLYFAFTAITGYEFGLAAVVLGFLIGAAVRAGSRRRGGLAYQLLAVFLSYTAIVASYAGLVIQAMYQEHEAEVEGAKPAAIAVAAKDAPQNTPPAETAAVEVAKNDTAPPANEEVAGETAAKPQDNAEKPVAVEVAGETAAKPQDNAEKPVAVIDAPVAPTPEDEEQAAADVPLAVGALAVLLFLYQIPIQANMDSPIGLLIIGFALWEAWKLNRRTPLVFNGPFTLEGATPAPSTEPPGHA